jgi:conjugal transfer ATP-binding protein TraC
MNARINDLHQLFGKFFGDINLMHKKENPEINFASMADYLPYKFYDKIENIFINDESAGFILQIGNLFGANQKDLEVISNLLRDNIPNGAYLQIMNYASPRIGDILENYNSSRAKAHETIKFLMQKRVDFVKNGNWADYSNENSNYRIRNFKTFLIFSLPFKNKSSDIIDKIIEIKTRNEKLKIDGKIKELVQIRKNFNSLLNGIGLGGRDLSINEFMGFIDEILNANAEDLLESKPKYNEFEIIANQVIDIENKIEVKEDSVHLFSDNPQKHIIAKAFSFKQYPYVFSQNDAINLIGDYENDIAQISCAFIQTMCVFFPFKAEETKAKIKLKSIKLQKNKENTLFRFFSSISEESNEYNFITKKLDEGQRLVEIYSGVLLLAKPENIENASRNLIDIYSRSGFNLIVDKYFALQSYLTFFPFMLGDGLFDDLKSTKRTEKVLSWNVANLMPLQGEMKGNVEPCMLLFGRRGQIYNFHPFKSPAGGNFNTCIVGKSGSGKSFFMQDYMTGIRGIGGKMIVIDDGQSFQKLCLLLGGKYIEFTEGNKICLNPFTLLKKEEDLKKILKDASDDDVPDRVNFYDEVVNFIIKIIRTIICREDEICSKIESEIISEAVKEVAKKFGYKGDLKCVYNILIDWYKDKNPDKPIEITDLMFKIALRMKSFTEGDFSKYFIGEANIEIDNDCVVFELSHIKDKPELQRIITLFASFLGFKEMYLGDRGQIKSFVVDEAWALLSGKEMSEFMEGMARRARKYNGQLVIATQSIEDFYKSPATTAILQNSDYLCILSQKAESITTLEKSGKVGDMSAHLKNTLLSLRTQKGKYSEVVIYAHGSYHVARLIVDPFSAKLYSSDAKDFKQVQDLMKKGYSVSESLDIIINNPI